MSETHAWDHNYLLSSQPMQLLFFLNDCNVVSSSLHNHKIMSVDILCPLIADDNSWVLMQVL